MKKIFLTFLLAVVLCSCVSETAKQTLAHYNEVYVKVDEMETLLKQVDLSAYSASEIIELHEVGKSLSYSFNPMDLKPEQIAACELLKQRVENVKSEIIDQTTRVIKQFRLHPWQNYDYLMEQTKAFPVYMVRGEKLYWNIKAQKPLTVKVYNADTRQLLKTYTGKTFCVDSLSIQNTAIYLVEIAPNGTQYVEMDINYKSNDMQRLKSVTKVKEEDVECDANDFRAKKIPGVSMQKCFEEPRKFTLRSQFRKAPIPKFMTLRRVQITSFIERLQYKIVCISRITMHL